MKTATATDPYLAWCEAHGVSHGHCPQGCEHPQPAMTDDGRLICMRCLCVEGLLTLVVPCGAGVCG